MKSSQARKLQTFPAEGINNIQGLSIISSGSSCWPPGDQVQRPALKPTDGLQASGSGELRAPSCSQIACPVLLAHLVGPLQYQAEWRVKLAEAERGGMLLYVGISSQPQRVPEKCRKMAGKSGNGESLPIRQKHCACCNTRHGSARGRLEMLVAGHVLKNPHRTNVATSKILSGSAGAALDT